MVALSLDRHLAPQDASAFAPRHTTCCRQHGFHSLPATSQPASHPTVLVLVSSVFHLLLPPLSGSNTDERKKVKAIFRQLTSFASASFNFPPSRRRLPKLRIYDVNGKTSAHDGNLRPRHGEVNDVADANSNGIE